MFVTFNIIIQINCVIVGTINLYYAQYSTGIIPFLVGIVGLVAAIKSHYASKNVAWLEARIEARIIYLRSLQNEITTENINWKQDGF